MNMIFHNSKTMEFVRLIHAKINRVLVGHDTCDSLIDRWIAMLDWLHSMICKWLFCICALTLSFVIALILRLRYVSYLIVFICYHTCPAFTPLITARYPQLIDQLLHWLHLISRDLFLGTYMGVTVFIVPSR